ncbi:hypothetical protein EJ06DRAFT_575719 [Trichodelitschia bisporula]|uniref:Rhodopsin domain-containing protein n=1 Tax=Trichodelitschia bisporula TaxID=703511 RepID=A0A6G1HYW0_9PEZI|nr:hypothetical protein EJ06DRAFT_575719 [Trichodelitschia bisporula]
MAQFPDFDTAGWPEPNYESPERRGNTMLAVNLVAASLALITAAMRIYTRLFITRWFGADDVFIIFALIFALSVVALFCTATLKFGFDRHMWDLQPDLAAGTGKIVFLHNILFVSAANATHVSWLCFYYRVVLDSDIEWFRNLLHLSVAAIMSLFIVFLSLAIRLCMPIKAMWAFPPVEDARCLRKGQITVSGGIIKTLIDFMLIALPVPLLMRLTMRTRQRRGLLALIGLGIVVPAAGSVRIYNNYQMYFVSTDRTWVLYRAYSASALEGSLGIICACVPTLRPVLSSFLEWAFEPFSELGRARRSDPSGSTQPKLGTEEPRSPLDGRVKSMASRDPIAMIMEEDEKDGGGGMGGG